MPGYLFEPIDRQQFLRTTSRFLGALVVTSTATGQAIASPSLRVALLSDTHIPADPANGHRGFRPVDNLRQVVEQVTQVAPAFALINGDAARLTGQVEDYAALRTLLQPLSQAMPVHICMGNHDDRHNFWQVFPPEPGQPSQVKDKHVTVIETTTIRFILLDSLLYVDKVAGLLGQAQRTWLEQYLHAMDQRPTCLFVHHTLGDGDGELLDAERLLRMVEPFRQVKGIFYGHSHRYETKQHGKIHLINLPAVGYNFRDEDPIGWIEATFDANSVALKLHAVGGNRAGHHEVKTLAFC